jgi:hypothetical protein
LDPLHLDEPASSWSRAVLNPSVWAPAAALVTLSTVQLVQTDRCIAENKPACNFVFQKNKKAAFAVNIPLTAGLVWFAAREKQKGHRATGLVVSLLALIGEAPVAYTANSHELACVAGRTPVCH